MACDQKAVSAGESRISIPRSLSAQVTKYAQVNSALVVHVVSHQASHAAAAAALKDACAKIVDSIPPGVLASDSIISEDAMLKVLADGVWHPYSVIMIYRHELARH
jgi:hypothetical protein